MRQLFISYARENKPDVEALVRDLEALGYPTWVDSSLRGGQAWWEEILRRIADCDVFLAIVSRHTLNSLACKRELEWALALNKPVLPVAVERLPDALPRALSMRQIVDYSKSGREAAFAFAGALRTLPTAPPPPEQLPDPPPAPLPYLSDLVDQVSEPEPLTHEQQRQILIQLQAVLRSVDLEERRGGPYLLETFIKRHDLYADVYRTLAQLGLAEHDTHASMATGSTPNLIRPVDAGTGKSRQSSRRRIGKRNAGARLSSAVFAPPAVGSGDNFVVYVFAHVPEDDALVESLARKYDRRAAPRGSVGLRSLIRQGELLAFELLLPGLVVDDPVQSMVWFGRAQSVQFGVTVPPDLAPRNVVGTVMISRDSVPLGHLKFNLSVCEPGTIPVPAGKCAPSPEMHRYNRAFISYASADRNEVLKRTQMLAKVGVDFFQDILTLDPGERWERRLYLEIDRSDVFYLFWSSAAKTSTWVIKEVQYAMMRNGGNELAPPEIVPVIIEGPPPVEAPPELAHLHFDDRMIYFMQPKRTNWFSPRWRRGR